MESRHLPACPTERDHLILALFGSPDPRQIDGLGGADPLTSKLAIIGPSDSDEADLNYTFAQVGIERPVVNFEATCGNIPAGIGVFAMARGLLPLSGPEASIRVLNTNTGKRMRLTFDANAGPPRFAMDGVPGLGSEVQLDFEDPTGAMTGRFLPSGNGRDTVQIGGRAVEVSIVDAGALFAFVSARSFGRTGSERVEELQADRELVANIDRVRAGCAQLLYESGAVDRRRRDNLARYFKVAIVGEGDPDLGPHVHARIMNPERGHKAFAVTGAIALGAARSVGCTVVAEIAGSPEDGDTIIGHPCGTIRVKLRENGTGRERRLVSASISRTARLLMDGQAYLPE